MNKKIVSGIVIVAIIAIIATACFFGYKKYAFVKSGLETFPQVNEREDSKEENGFRISDKWTLVSHYNFWSNPNFFKRSAYEFPNIEFSYPENWEFQCCNDMDHASTHIIYSSKNRDKSLPYIRITDYVLSGCPDSQDRCSLDKIVEITADEKFNRLTSVVPIADVFPKTELNNLDTTAFVYNKPEENSMASKGYIINLGNDVIEVDFVNYELLGGAFIENFLNRISFEVK